MIPSLLLNIYDFVINEFLDEVIQPHATISGVPLDLVDITEVILIVP